MKKKQISLGNKLFLAKETISGLAENGQHRVLGGATEPSLCFTNCATQGNWPTCNVNNPTCRLDARTNCQLPGTTTP